MDINIKKLRMDYSIKVKDMVEILETNRQSYLMYEKGKYLPDFLYYTFSKKYPEILPLPTDFMKYTSYSLKEVIKRQRCSRNKLLECLNYKSQTSLTDLFKKNYCLYDQKELIDNFLKENYPLEELSDSECEIHRLYFKSRIREE